MHIQGPPKILIIESQMIIAADISVQFSKLGYEVIGIHTRAEDALKTIDNNRPDIVVLNVESRGKTAGLKTARKLAETYQIPVVFISANTDRETFKEVIALQPYAFITKPFKEEDLQRGIETALGRMFAEGSWRKKTWTPSSAGEIFIQQKGQLIKVYIDDVLFVEANRNNCRLTTAARKYQLTVPLRVIEGQLPADQFIRVHRSFLVNLQEINTLQEYGKYLTIQEYQIPISRRQRQKVFRRIKSR